MLFSFGDNVVESEKERNLYYKFFAGYFLNELLPGWENRLHQLAMLIDSAAQVEAVRLERPIALRPSTTHVSFDCHAYLLNDESDRGEFADIMLHDTESRCLIAIEAKFLSDWNFKKDIIENGKRLSDLRDKLPDGTQIVQCLLVKESKWHRVALMAKHQDSNFTKLARAENRLVVPLFWERLIGEHTDPVVRDFMEQHLRKDRHHFRLTLRSNDEVLETE
jgi:hypothetical protein